MGLSRNIDLTEKGDFGSVHWGDSFDDLVLSNQDIEIYRLNDDSPMTNETYHRIQKYYSLFGYRYHYNEFNKVFDKDGKFEKEVEEHCYCCGKPLRIPWKKRRGLCEKCNKEYDDKEANNIVPFDILPRCPWSGYTMLDSREILSLR